MADDKERVLARVMITGRVQGVWFRGRARDTAQSLGLCGYVRNLPDGRVEAVFEGPAQKVQQAIAWCHRGPRLAHVTSVDVEWGDAGGEHADFTVSY